jgi:hypothetical protein
MSSASTFFAIIWITLSAMILATIAGRLVILSLVSLVTGEE